MNTTTRSTLHHVAAAIRELWPECRLLESGELQRPHGGFYQDIESPQQLSLGSLRQLGSTVELFISRSHAPNACPHFALLDVEGVAEGGTSLPPGQQRIRGIAHADALTLRREVARHEGALERCAQKLAGDLELVGQSGWTTHGEYVLNRLEKFVSHVYERYGYRQSAVPLSAAKCEGHTFWFSPRRQDSATCMVADEGLSARVREIATMAAELHSALNLNGSITLDSSNRRPAPTYAFSELSQITSELLQVNDASATSCRWNVDDLYGLPTHATASLDCERLAGEPPRAQIHATLTGGLESLLARVLERTGGALPYWFCPRQVCVIPVSAKFLDYGREALRIFAAAGLASNLDERNELMTFKRRRALDEGAAAVAMVGEEEEKARTVTLIEREWPGRDLRLPLSSAVNHLRERNRSPLGE